MLASIFFFEFQHRLRRVLGVALLDGTEIEARGDLPEDEPQVRRGGEATNEIALLAGTRRMVSG